VSVPSSQWRNSATGHFLYRRLGHRSPRMIFGLA
jgi:hypothetical protein